MNNIQIDKNELKRLLIALLFLFITIIFVISLFYIRNTNSIDEDLNNNIPTLNYLCFYDAEEASKIIIQNSDLEVITVRLQLSDYFLSTIDFNYERLSSLELRSSVIEILKLAKYNFQCIGKISGSNVIQGESYANLYSKNINSIEIVEIYIGPSPIVIIFVAIIFFVLFSKIFVRKT